MACVSSHFRLEKWLSCRRQASFVHRVGCGSHEQAETIVVLCEMKFAFRHTRKPAGSMLFTRASVSVHNTPNNEHFGAAISHCEAIDLSPQTVLKVKNHV